MATPTVADSTRVCYLYGIVRADRRPLLTGVVGVGGGPVSLVESGSLVAVVADIASEDLSFSKGEHEDTSWLEAAVRAHEDVLERCLEPGPVLPMRFATTLREDDDVTNLLRDREAELSASLERLLGRREWGVKAFLRRPEILAQHVRAGRPDLASAEAALEDRSAGAAYLARKRLDQEFARAGDDVVAEFISAAHRRLAEDAVEVRLMAGSQLRTEKVLLNAAYLVAEDGEQEFRQSLAELRRDHAGVGLEYELTGPWPAYNFTTDEVEQ